ncbi:Rhodanese domain-containing protein [Favolaschia claudopus]|uniref:Rhodanese domain-containing protein n=1 Tax=Favolaschia claudopus TaxID=2862362 RepID=A0AAW0CV50_9AGAR
MAPTIRSSTSVASRESVAPVPSTLPSTLPRRTLDDVRDQVASEVAVRTISRSESVDGVRVGVTLTLSKSDDEDFLRRVAIALQERMILTDNLFAIATTGSSTYPASSPKSTYNTLLICGSPEFYVQRAVLLASAKFPGRIQLGSNDGLVWISVIRNISPMPSSADELALWDALRKSARAPMDPLLPPPGTRGVAESLAIARSRLQRLTPAQAHEEILAPAVDAPTFLVDIRSESSRAEMGAIAGSLIIDRNVLEWRFDPRLDLSERLIIADRFDLRIIILCEDGTASSLAAASLLDIGMLNATDVVGGYRGWLKAGLPVDLDPEVGTEPSVIHIME